MKPLTVDEMYEHRINKIVRRLLKDTGAELKDFKSTDDLLDYLNERDIAAIFGRYMVEDMTDWKDDWLETIND